MECLYGFLANISRDLVCGAVNQLRYPCCFNNFVEELEKEERNLIATTKDVKDRIAHEKKQSRRTAEVVHKWDEDADKYVDDVNQLLNEARTKQNCCFGHCPDWIFRYRSGKKLAKKKTELEEFIKKGGPYVLLERAATLPSGILDSNSEKYLSFGSRQKAYEELIEAVKDDKVGMIGLCGMGGCGKTTMAMEVLKKAEAEHLFDKVLFVPVSSTVEVRTIQDKIASSLQYTFEEDGEREKAKRLYERLTQEDKILVILDDVWQILDFYAIGIPSPEHHKGCKVLITTRSVDVCNSMDCRKTIHLSILENDEAWTLFQKEANINEGTSDAIKDLARQISDECKGLPVAIAAVASTLKGKEKVTWKVALNRLRSSKPVNIDRGLQDPYKCLELSYHCLDDEAAKSLFLLCSVFPEDYEIRIELLARCAIGLGLVGEVRSYEEARDEVIAAKLKLMSSCLLLDASDDKYERVKMHDLVRDVAHLIAKNENKGIKCQVENDMTLENSDRYLWCKKLPNDLDYSNLEFLYVASEVEVLDEVFTRMKKLRVLILEGERWKGSRLLSTMSFKSLTNLRCLILSWWKLNDISFIRYMKKLESLSLRKCLLPSFIDLQKDDAVSHLTKLKLLVLHLCVMERNIVEVIGRIPQLEELHIVDGYDLFTPIERFKEFYETFSVPQTLQRYTIIYGRSSGHSYDLFTRNERTLVLRGWFDISNEALMGLAKKAKNLGMGNIKGSAKNITPNIFQLEGGGMPELNQLYIWDAEEIECLVDNSNHTSEVVGSLFSSLNALYLDNCPKLTCLFTQAITPEDPVRYTIFQNLQQVTVRKCGELKYVFSANTVGGLTQLKRLRIEYCNQLEQIVEDIIPSVANQLEIIEENTSTPSGSFTLSNIVSPRPYFPKLKQVEVVECHKLKRLFSASTSNDLPYLEELIIYGAIELEELIGLEQGAFNNFQFQHLKTLEIKRCAKLEVIFTMSIVRCLPELEFLMIRECKELKHIMEEDENDRIQKELKPCFPKLKQVDVAHCHKLKRLFSTSASASNDLPYLEKLIIHEAAELEEIIGFEQGAFNIFQFQHLKILEIIRCAKLEVIFTVSVVRYLPELECLLIIECKELKHIMEEDESDRIQRELKPCFPKLKQVVVRQCHKLKRLFSTSTSNDLPYLEELIIDEAAELEELIGFEQGAFNIFQFQHLKILEIIRCAKLEVIFTVSVVRYLPELEFLVIRECKELKHIMEEDESDRIQRELKPCFPKLTVVIVEQCHKLKHLFCMNGADEQRKGEEIGNAKVELPKLKLLILMHLSNLCQGIELRAPRHCIINNCPKLSLTSTTTLQELYENIHDSELANLGVPAWELKYWIRKIKESNEVSKSGNTSEFPSTQVKTSQCTPGELLHQTLTAIIEELEKEFIGEVHGSEVHATATSTNSELNRRPSLSPLDMCQHETHSQELVNGQSSSGSYLKDQQEPLGETESTIAIPQIGVEEGTASENVMMVLGI